MSAALEDDDAIAVGDEVFVHPNEWAPPHLRGIQGTVVALEGVEAQLRPNSSDQLHWVNRTLLRPNRRRRHVPANWEALA